jgi:hypothetical protein
MTLLTPTSNLPASHALDLYQAIFVFDPNALAGPQIGAFYVDRRISARAEMSVLLQQDIKAGRPVKLLFMGHMGSGKSTELNRLCEDLEKQFFIVKVSTRRLVEPTSLTYTDIILIAAISLFSAAVEHKVVSRAPAQIVEETLKDIQSFMQQRIFGGQVRARLDEPEVGFKINAIVAEFEMRYRNEPTTRDQIRGRMADHLSEVIQKIDGLAALIRANDGRPLLFVFDDTDKPDRERAENIFFDHSATLTDFRASAIYTIPISMCYSVRFNNFRDYFSGRYRLPNMTLQTRDGARDERGWEIMRTMVSQRMSDALIDENARDAIIAATGGLTRGLITLMRFAAVHAAGRGAARIEMADAQHAINELKKDFNAALEEKHYPILAARHADKWLSSDDVIQDLLYMGALLEYENGRTWCDVHPLVLQLLEEREKR